MRNVIKRIRALIRICFGTTTEFRSFHGSGLAEVRDQKMYSYSVMFCSQPKRSRSEKTRCSAIHANAIVLECGERRCGSASQRCSQTPGASQRFHSGLVFQSRVPGIG